MLRQALPLARQVLGRPIGRNTIAQWPVTRPNVRDLQVQVSQLERRLGADIDSQRTFASKPTDSNTKPSIHDSDTIVLPGTQSRTVAEAQPPPPGPVLSASPTAHGPKPTSETIIPPQQVPLVPPTPPGGKFQTAPPTSIPPASGRVKPITPTPPSNKLDAASVPPPSPPPSPPKRKSRWFRRSLQTLFILTVLGYAGGTYYSLVSDNFHDFFTEYVPFGGDCVFYFEEREFRKRFPNATNPANRSSADPGGNKITIPSKSGLSWRVANDEHQGSDSQTKGSHVSALDANKPNVKVEPVQQNPSVAEKPKDMIKAVEKAKNDAPPSPSPEIKPAKTKPKGETSPPKRTDQEKPGSNAAPAPAPKPKKTRKEASMKSPEVDEPSIAMPLQRIDLLKHPYADEPLVQDLVKIVNDIITVVNDDNASNKFSSTINKAKSELAGVGNRIMSLKQAEKQAAEAKIRSTQIEFDNAAKELVRRLEEEMRSEQARWREEFESEREMVSQSYQERLKTETQRAQEVSNQLRRNELLEQAVAMKKQFLSEVTDRVETERNGRLSKLSDLSTSVTELEKLTADWNSVIDANLKTQHLTVAVEAVRSSLETADRPRPFIKELAALKEIASDDSVVNAAIASINPTAYQRGVPTSAQLIDRFRRVAAEVRKASLLPEDAGVASHAASFVLSKFMFKKKGMTVGDDVESVLTRTETLLEEGNLDEAAREMNTLDGWAKTLSWDWLSECRRVLEVRQAMDVIATEARLEGLKVD